MNRILIFITTGLILTLSSCLKDEGNDQRDLEMRILENYINENYPDLSPLESGLYFIEDSVGTGPAPVKDDYVLMNYTMFTVEDEEMIYSYDEEKAEDNDIYNKRNLYGPSKILVGTNILALDIALTEMKEGGKARIIFPSDLGYGGYSIGSVPAYSSLIMDIELLEVIEEPVVRERNKIEEYLVENDIQQDSTESGIYHIVLEEGTGDSVQVNDYGDFNITAKLLDGRELFSVTEYDVKVGDYSYILTEGLSEGLRYMKEGEHAHILTPYYRGYGVNGLGARDAYGTVYSAVEGKTPVPAYSTILYEVKLNHIID